MAFNQLAPTVNTILNTSNCLIYGNTASGAALSVQQLGAGNVFSTSNANGTIGLFVSATSNVGIGTTIPTAALQVVGAILSTGFAVAQPSALPSSQAAWMGWNRSGSIVNGATAFMNQQGGGLGGWEWINYNSGNQLAANCAFLSSVGGLTLGTYSNVTSAPTGGLICPGKVGIGTNNPTSLLHVQGGDVYASSNINGNAGNTTWRIQPAYNAAAPYNSVVRFVNAWDPILGTGQANYGAVGINLNSYQGGSQVEFYTAATNNAVPTERMRIAANGNVGIGSASPGSLLTCGSAYTNGGTHAEETGSKIILGCNNQTGPYGVGIQMRVPANSTVNESDMQFTTCDNSGNQLVRMTIKGTSNPVGGNVGIGTASPQNLFHIMGEQRWQGLSGGTVPADYWKFFHNANATTDNGFQFSNATATVMTFRPTGAAINVGIGLAGPGYQLDLSTDGARKLTSTTWLTGSDERIKTDIQSANLQTCYDIVNSIDLKYFKWNFPESSNIVPDDKHSLGFIAQEVKSVFPNAVSESNSYGYTDFLSLNTDQILKAMYGALKKTMNDNEDLKKSQATSAGAIASLESRLAALEAKLNPV